MNTLARLVQGAVGAMTVGVCSGGLQGDRMKYVEGVSKSFIDECAIECLRLAQNWRGGSRPPPDQARLLNVEEVHSPAKVQGLSAPGSLKA